MNGLWTEKEMTVEAVIEEDQRCVQRISKGRKETKIPEAMN